MTILNELGETMKAGSFVVKLDTKQIALIYRDKQKDYTFPKGHLEENESLEECAVRETAEEIKREVKLLDIPPYIEQYTTPKGKKCICYMYIAIDVGPSDNQSTDTHTLIWTDFDKVEEMLSYETLHMAWNYAKPHIAKLLKIKK